MTDTAATQAEIDAGSAALKAAVDQMLEAAGEGFEEFFIPDDVFSTGSADAISAADSAADQSPAGRQAAAAAALRAAIDAAGYGAQVADDQVSTCAAAVLSAVAALRAKQPTQNQES